MIAETFFVLVGPVVFLVDDDQAQILNGSKERAACADGNLGISGSEPLPLSEAVAGFETAMQYGDFVTESRAYASDELVGECDLGNQDERLAVGLECFFGGL